MIRKKSAEKFGAKDERDWRPAPAPETSSLTTLRICLGATAAQTIFGPAFRVTRDRGKILASALAPKVVATVHPSSLLRQPDEESREREYKLFLADLRGALKAAR
ncbi:MAG: hypothetical protein LC642_06710 [Verrucomicrobiaceae bacterium]|nr:hypothetical protein [Verrucomicrobiaceae bacterium]